MRIGIVAGGIPPEYIGGAEVQSSRLAEKLATNHNVILFVKSKRNLEFNKGRLKVVKRNFLDIKKINIFSAAFSLYKSIKKYKNKIDVLICFQTAPAGIVGLMAKKFLDIPYIQMIRSINDCRGNTSLGSKWLVKTVFNNAYLLVVQTESIKSLVKRHFSHKDITIIRNALDIPKKKSSGKNLIFLGSLSTVKGVKYLISALKMMSNPPHTLIIGDGPERKLLEEKARGLDIKFVGQIKPDEVVKYLQAGNFLVVPSLSEASPNVILEAMSVGLPVIATKVGGVPDIIEHGKTGFLVKPRNPKEIRKYIKILLKDDMLRKKISRNCLKEVKKYSWKNIIPQIETVLRKVIEQE